MQSLDQCFAVPFATCRGGVGWGGGVVGVGWCGGAGVGGGWGLGWWGAGGQWGGVAFGDAFCLVPFQSSKLHVFCSGYPMSSRHALFVQGSEEFGLACPSRRTPQSPLLVTPCIYTVSVLFSGRHKSRLSLDGCLCTHTTANHCQCKCLPCSRT